MGPLNAFVWQGSKAQDKVDLDVQVSSIFFYSKLLQNPEVSLRTYPANIRLDEDVLKTSFVFVFRRRLDQDEYVCLSLTSSEDVFKTSWSRSIYSSWPYVFKTSSRRLQDRQMFAGHIAQKVKDLVIYTEENINGKLYFLCSATKHLWRTFFEN